MTEEPRPPALEMLVAARDALLAEPLHPTFDSPFDPAEAVITEDAWHEWHGDAK